MLTPATTCPPVVCDTTITDANALKAAIENSATGIVNICAASEIYWNETISLGQLRINSNTGDLQAYKLFCVVNAPGDRCTINFTPQEDCLANTACSAYGQFVIEDGKEFTVDGFDFKYRDAKGPMFYNQLGSTLMIKNCLFEG